MTASQTRKAVLPAIILALASAAPASAQCVSDTWTLSAATGEVAEIEIRGNVAWIAAVGGLIRIDLATLGQENPDQIKITDDEGLVSADISCLTIDGFGNVYVGTREDGISVFDSRGNHLGNLSSFDEFAYSDLVISIQAVGDTLATYDAGTRMIRGDRVVVSSVDSFSAQGNLVGGGIKTFFVERESDGGFRFTPEPGLGISLELVREILVEPGAIWAGTSGRGLWRRDETVSPPSLTQVLNAELLSSTVKQVLLGPPYDGSPGEVFWIGMGAGVQTWDRTTLTEVPFFTGRNILDLHIDGTEIFVLAEQNVSGVLVRDLYRMDVSQQPVVVERVPRSTCLPDTLYVPLQVATDASGRAVLGTREDSFSIYGSGGWSCVPPLGPHSPSIADVVLAPDGTLYFGTARKNDATSRGNGLGWLGPVGWRSLTPTDNPEMLSLKTTEVSVWPDGTVWFGSNVSRDTGGLNRLFPATGAVEKYHDDVVDQSRLTLGRNVWSIEQDAANNLWVAYGQNPAGGLSVVEYPSLQVTNFDFLQIFARSPLLRDIAIDSQGRIWATTNNTTTFPGQVYVVDTNGTISNKSDDVYTAFNVANDIADIGVIPFVAIDDSDQIWLAGESGLVVGQIGPDVGTGPSVNWQVVNGTAAQLGGRNPLPYTTGALDWDNNLWLGTEASGIVRISKDLETWTWIDELECPLPDQTITGIHIDEVGRQVYVGTATGGIAAIDMAAELNLAPGRLDPLPFPNPWRPNSDGILSFSGIPVSETVAIRIYNVNGDLVYQADNLRGSKSWDGRNLGSQVVESGLYIVMAMTASGEVYEGKVAVIR